jgi:hypothetical protein
MSASASSKLTDEVCAIRAILFCEQNPAVQQLKLGGRDTDGKRRYLQDEELVTSVCSSCNHSVGKTFRYVIRTWVILQYMIFMGSVCTIFFLRISNNMLIPEISVSWGDTCYKRYSFFAGMSYVLAALGLTQPWLLPGTIRSLGNKLLTLKPMMKYIVEFMTLFYVLSTTVLLFVVDYFSECGEGQRADLLRRATRLLLICLAFNQLTIISLCLNLWLKRLVATNDQVKLYYDTFIKSNF